MDFTVKPTVIRQYRALNVIAKFNTEIVVRVHLWTEVYQIKPHIPSVN
jgi:hypothetical protein